MREDLRTIRLFAGLQEPELERVAGYLEEHRFDPGQPVIREDVEEGRCYFLLEGTVRVSSSMRKMDQEEVYSFLRAGDHFGEISMVDRQPPAASVIAEEPCRLLSISHGDLRRLMEDDPKLANGFLWAMLESFCRRLRETNQSLSFARFLMKRPGG